MSRFCPLYSGSSGNSTYLSGGGTGVLIDAGVSCKAIMQGLRSVEEQMPPLSGIVITHEHDDHIKGLRVFLKKMQVPVYGPAKVLEYIASHCDLPSDTQLIDHEGKGFYIENIYVEPFKTPHDSLDSCGYRFSMPDGRRIGVATDLGCYTSQVEQGLSGCDLVMLESNYDSRMLDCSAYPYFLKRRIKAQDGHLDNKDCAAAAAGLARSGSTRFVLAHLSKENNMALLAKETTEAALSQLGMEQGKDFTVQVANRSEPSPMIIL